MRDGMTPLRMLPLVAVLAAGCASTMSPVLYPNARYNQVGVSAADADLAACEAVGRQVADKVAEGSLGRDVVTGGGVGAATGAAGGAVWGAIQGGAASGAGAGAAGGAAAGILGALLGNAMRSHPPDPVYKAAVEQCLRDRGYQIAGWR